ncbi:MAG: B12-binding domain-containing radical SAM protein [Thermoplasmatales archaeon]|nr:MAG: B12-binding domain-containing radical SAM protein [Thermoplasmatales archaeon]
MMSPISLGSLYGSYHSALIYPPLELEYIGASLLDDGHEVEIIDFNLEKKPIETLKNSLLSSDAVGISVYSNNIKYVSNVAKMIKELNPEIPIIIGGPHCIFFQDRSLLDVPHADICVIGEGEQVIIDIVRYFQGKKNLSDIHGIYYRDKDKIKSGKPLKVIENLDSLCFPARHLVDKYDYGKTNNRYVYTPKFTTMHTSRGCPFKCRFCARYGNVVKNWGFRQRSVDNIVKEIQEIDRKFGSVMITDDNFLSDNKRAHKIMDKIIESRTNIELMIEGTRIDTADKKLYLKMKKANVKFIVFGIESGNQDVLDFYNKRITLDQIRKAVHLSNKMGFITMGSFILAGPIETKEHVKKTIKFACSLPLDGAIFYPFAYQMGSPLWYEAVENKIISKGEYMVPALSSRGLGNFTEEESDEYAVKAFKRFYLRPSFLISQIYRSFLRKDFKLIKYAYDLITSSRK